eukprot:Skav205713  [mRNA]  locus=scaffold608:44665:46853:- [translate_table: standard]
MSGEPSTPPASAAQVHQEVEELRRLVEALLLRVEALESQAEWGVVSGSGAAGTSAAAADTESTGSALDPSRLSAARSIGQWILRCLSGAPRGLSGRERISQSSRLYLAALMAEESSASEAESNHPEGFDLATSFVLSGSGEADFQYPLLQLANLDEAYSVECIAVTRVATGQVLLCVPDSAWHRKKAKRVLPAGALTKVTKATVASCSNRSADAREAPEAEPSLVVWLGLLDVNLEEQLSLADVALVAFPLDSDGFALIPYGPALVAMAQDHFTFHTATEAGEKDNTDRRLSSLEDNLAKLTTMMEKLLPQASPSKHTGYREPALKKKPEKKQSARIPPGLNPMVAQQALQAGVSQEALAEVGALVGFSPTQLPATAQAPDQKELTSEEEEAEAAGAGLADPMSKAVVQLTHIVQSMHADRKKKKDRSLDAILDVAEYGSAKESTGASSSSRSHAAALRSLQRTLQENPKLLHQEIERRMAEDWESTSLMPGTAHRPTSARAWLEHRSKVGNFAGAIRPAWMLAGALDDLRSGAIDRARARLCLGLAAYDQQSYDRGSWLLAAEMSLEHPPPYGAFAGRLPPDVWEQPHTRLVDPRWFDVMVSRVRNLADYHDKKSKLGATPGKGKGEDNANKTDPNPAAKKKRQPKGGKKGSTGQKAEEVPPASTS